ncbi:MAG: tetratricopeptide repeat protein [Pseudolabrys sp.]
MRIQTGVAPICLSALAFAAGHTSAARAQSADLVLCDRLAAHPDDPDRPADIKGVAEIANSDVAIALKYCKIASTSSRRALFELGRAYAANKQFNEAVATYRKAVDKGSTTAMVELGVLYGTGTGIAKDPAEARKLFERAAQGGNPRAVTNLAALSGGVPQIPAQARGVLSKAADANSPEAQYQLGLMLAQGTGGTKDDAAARVLFEKAAAQGHAEAMVWAGAFAQLGRGGPEAEAAAKSYFQKAAALGSEEGRERLKRIECPRVLKDKQGNVLTRLCF